MLNTYTITTTITGGSGGTITPSSPTVDYGGSQTFNISADSCYRLTDVKVDGVFQGAITSYTFTNITANHSIEASFAIVENVLIWITRGPYDGIISWPGGSCTEQDRYGCKVYVSCGASPTFNFIPDTGYHVDNVKVDGISQGNIANYTFNNATALHKLYAYFAPNLYTLTVTKSENGSGTVTSSPTGISCGTTCSGTFGGSLTLTATPDTNSTFTGWSGSGCNGTGDCTVAMTTDTNVTATFGCSASPIRIPGKADYSTLQAAYNAAVDGDTILSRGITLTEYLSADMNKSVTIEGGYTCDYSSSPGVTSLSGSMSINNGTVNIKNFNLQN